MDREIIINELLRRMTMIQKFVELNAPDVILIREVELMRLTCERIEAKFKEEKKGN